MWNKICRWYVRTFGPINQIQNYISENLNNCFDSHSFDNLSLEVKRWVLDDEKKLEIVQYSQQAGKSVYVYLDMELIVTYDIDYPPHPFFNISTVAVIATKEELEYLYKHISKYFK